MYRFLITFVTFCLTSAALAFTMIPQPTKRPADFNTTKPATKTWPPGYKGTNWLPPLEIQNKVAPAKK